MGVHGDCDTGDLARVFHQKGGEAFPSSDNQCVGIEHRGGLAVTECTHKLQVRGPGRSSMGKLCRLPFGERARS